MLAASAAAGLAARGEAEPVAKEPEVTWKVKVVKAKAAAPPKGIAPWYRPVTYADLPGWAQDDHLAAFKTFLASCVRVIGRQREVQESDRKGPQPPPAALVAACMHATRVADDIASKESARAFFEANFTPNAVAVKGQTGLLTGYYEPVLEGSRTPDGKFQTPIYKRPPDLVNVVHDTQRGALKPGALTHVRKTA